MVSGIKGGQLEAITRVLVDSGGGRKETVVRAIVGGAINNSTTSYLAKPWGTSEPKLIPLLSDDAGA